MPTKKFWFLFEKWKTRSFEKSGKEGSWKNLKLGLYRCVWLNENILSAKVISWQLENDDVVAMNKPIVMNISYIHQFLLNFTPFKHHLINAVLFCSLHHNFFLQTHKNWSNRFIGWHHPLNICQNEPSHHVSLASISRIGFLLVNLVGNWTIPMIFTPAKKNRLKFIAKELAFADTLFHRQFFCMLILLIESIRVYSINDATTHIHSIWLNRVCGGGGGDGGAFVSLIVRNYLLGFHFGNGALVLCRWK